MIQATQDSQWRWLNSLKNRATAGIDALEIESEHGGRKVERTPALNRILLFPGGYVVELDMATGDSSSRRHNRHASSPP